MQERTLNIVMTAVGIALCGTSVGMARHAGFGTDPFTVLVSGLDHRLDLGYGVIFTTLAAILLVGVFRLKRRLIGLATIPSDAQPILARVTTPEKLVEAFNAARGGVIDARHDSLAIGGDQGFNQRQCLIVIEGAEHGVHRRRRQLPFSTGNSLIGQA